MFWQRPLGIEQPFYAIHGKRDKDVEPNVSQGIRSTICFG
jgi:hypothetical protein